MQNTKQTVVDNGVYNAAYRQSQSLISAQDSGVENLWENFLYGLEKSKNGTAISGSFLGRRSEEIYKWESYEAIREKALKLTNAMYEYGCRKSDNIGIFSVNTVEWATVDLSCFAGNFVSIPMYSSFGKSAICHIINQTEMSIMFASGSKARDFCKMKADDIPSLKTIVVMDDDMNELEHISGLNVVSMTTFSKDNTATGKRTVESIARPDDVATICYTSGTTGMPKGVVLTHGNILSELAALEFAGRSGKLFTVTPKDVHISYLPLAHIFERIMTAFMTRSGAQIGYFRGITGSEASKALMEDIAILKPTIFISVPRIYNRLYEKVCTTIDQKGRLAKYLYETATKKKISNMKNKNVTTHFLWDCLVFSKLRQSLGGRVRVMVTGSAPLASKVMDFLRIAFNADVYEGYGQTETSAGLTVTLQNDFESGQVGCPLSNCEFKLVDIPDMNYSCNDIPFPRGEICVRGNQVFKGYYKEPEKTAEAFTDDGWYKTGDVGTIDAKGRLSIIDRRNCMFKLSQGEYIAPEKIENVITSYSNAISQIFVTGNSLESYPVAIVVPSDLTMTKEMLLEIIKRVCKENNLNGYETPQKIHVEHNPFPDDMLTPTFKLKRNVAKEHYAEIVNRLYLQ